MEEEDIDGISVKRVHRLGKRNANGDKPRPIIAKFTFHEDKELILSNARFLAGSDFGISQDLPREIPVVYLVERIVGLFWPKEIQIIRRR